MDWLPVGYLSMLNAEAGAGKTAVALWLACRYLAGHPWPDGSRPPKERGSVLWCQIGDFEKLAPLLEAVGATDSTGIRFPCLPQTPADAPVEAVDLNDGAWLQAISAVARSLQSEDGRAPWIIVDRIKASDGVALGAFKRLATELDSPIMLLFDRKGRLSGRHTKPVLRLCGEMATIIAIGPSHWSGDPSARLYVSKLADPVGAHERPPALRLRIVDDKVEVAHGREVSPTTRLATAVDWLRRELATGPKPAFHLLRVAQFEARISPNALRKAKKHLAVRSYKTARGWYWIAA